LSLQENTPKGKAKSGRQLPVSFQKNKTPAPPKPQQIKQSVFKAVETQNAIKCFKEMHQLRFEVIY
jgi:hypothetical protein